MASCGRSAILVPCPKTISESEFLFRCYSDPQIDVLTNVCLPIEVDEATTWNAIQPSFAEIMRARGAVPLSYATWRRPTLTCSPMPTGPRTASAPRKPRNSPIEEYLIGVLRGFSSIPYRRTGSRGPAPRLLYDPARIDPAAWLTEKLGEVTILGDPEPVANGPRNPEQTPIEPDAPPVRRCGWLIDTTGDVFRRCGEPITDGRDWCPTHRARRTAPPISASDWVPPLDWAAPSAPPALPSFDEIVAAAKRNPMTTGPIGYGQILPSDIYMVAGIGPLPGAHPRHFPDGDALAWLPWAM